MKTINKFLLVSLCILIVGLSCVSATDINDNNTQTNDTSLSNDDSQSISTTDVVDTIEDTQTTDNKTISSQDSSKTDNSDEKIVDNKTNLKSSEVIVITQDTWSNYFRYDEALNTTISTTLVSAGDTLDLQGEFYNVNFTIDKANITITSIGKTAMLYNCTINVQGLESSNSQVHNLTIRNNNYYGTGIYLNVTSNITIANNTIHVNGPYAFALAADQTNNSLIIDNFLRTSQRSDTTRTHTAVAMGSSYYNNIVNNTVASDDANGIYFSLWGSGLFQGGYCDYNNITNNTVIGGYSSNVTSWCYTIQVMGTYNIISNNTVYGGYRGISTQDFTNNTIVNNTVNATNQGIYACEGAIVENNYVNVNGSSAVGIAVGGSGAIIQNNIIITSTGHGIQISASKCDIINNTITSIEGYGIYSKGQYTNITIVNNTITSGKIGIIFKQQSSSKKINYITVSRNVIISSASAAIDFTEAGAKTTEDSHVTVDESNVLSCSLGTGLDVAYLAPSAGSDDDTPDSNKTYIVTMDNYYTYFTDENELNTRVVLKNDTLILQGVFTNVDFICTIKVHIIGQNCTIYNGTISFTEDASASSLTNVTIKNADRYPDVYYQHAVEILNVNNCNITNITILDNNNKFESIGILVLGSSGNTITNNYIFNSGDYVNYGIMVYASDLNTIANNTVYINQSSTQYEYADEIMFNDNIGTIQEILQNYGIVLLYSSYNSIDQNNVTTRSNFDEYTEPIEDCKNSVVGIDIYYDSNYNNVTNNIVDVESYGPYAYGMGVLGAPWGTSLGDLNATNNSFINNSVTVNGGYCATGFIAGLNSVNTTVDSNTFIVNARHNSTSKGDYAYGVTLESCYNTTFTNNIVNATAQSLYSVELFGTDYNYIANNTFYGEATYPYGVAGYQSDLNTITNNNFTMRGMDYGEPNPAEHTDSIPSGKEVIMLMNNCYNNTITYNTINTNATDTAVLLTTTAINTTVCENAIQSSSYIGDEAVTNNHNTNNVSNNFLYFTTITVYPVSGTVGYPLNITATITTTAPDTDNLTVTFRVGTSTVLGSSKVVDGVAQIQVNETSYLKATVYTIIATVSGTNYQNSTGTTSLNLNKTMTNSIVNVAKVTGLPGDTVTLVANVTDAKGSQVTGNVTFVLDGVTLGTVDLYVGRANITYKIPASETSGTHNITVIYNGNSDYSASEGSNILGVQTNSVTTVSSVSGIIGNTVTISARFTQNGQAITSGNATIMVNGSTVGRTTISNGRSTYTYYIPTNMKAGTYDITVIYEGNDTIAQSQASNTLTVNKTSSLINYNTTYSHLGEKTVITVVVTNSTGGFTASGGNMTISINGELIKNPDGTTVYGYVEDNVIKFTFNTPTTLRGSNNISFTYSGDDQFNSSSKTFTNGYVVYESSPVSSIITSDVSGKNGETIELVAKLYDQNGNVITTGQATFKINGNTIKVNGTGIKVNITNGEARYSFTIPNYSAKNYTITAVASINGTRVENSSILTVIKSDPTVELDGIVTTGSTGTLTGRIYDEYGSLVDIDTKIAIKINGKTVSSTRVYNGTINVTLDVSAYSSGIYNVTVVIGENNRFKTQTVYTALIKNVSNAFVTVPVQNKNGNVVSLTAIATDSNGNRVTGGSATFKLNGNTIKENGTGIKVSFVNGVARYNYTIPDNYSAKNYTLTGVANINNTRYETSTNLTIEKTNTTSVVNSMSISKGTNATLTGSVLDEDLKNVTGDAKYTVKINGKSVASGRVYNGTINVTLNTSSLSAGTYTVEFIVGENNRYTKSTTNTTLVIKN